MNNNPEYKKRRILKRRKRRQMTRRYVVIITVLYICLLLACVFGISLSLRSCNKPEAKYDAIIEKNETEKKELNKKELYFDEVFYLPVSAIGELTDIQEAGDETKLSFIIVSNSEFAKFYIDTVKAEVNSNPIELSHRSIKIKDELYLPFDFYTEHLSGIDLKIDEKSKSYTISPIAGEEIQFILKSPSETPSIDETNMSEVTDSPIDFVLDLSSYEEYMNPTDRDTYLILVSPDNPMDRSEEPTDLTGSIFTRSDRDTRMLRKYACLALEAFLKEGEANGIKGVTVTSAFRSYDYQKQLFDQEVSIRGSEEEAAKHVNPPGISEHQTGLAVDMHNMSAASTAFGDTKEAKWLADNAHNFGFILRYPKDKVRITGINYEPWHFRYVGRYHATKMHELDMCLEEYIEYINQ